MSIPTAPVEGDLDLAGLLQRADGVLSAWEAAGPVGDTQDHEDDRAVRVIEETVERESRQVADARELQRRLFDEGLAWISGPRELGGGGRPSEWATAVEALVDQKRLPSRAPLRIGLDIVAPAIAEHGSDDLRRRYLAGLMRGDLVGCQLFSEPGSGSDLAAARTSAVRDGDSWIVNGQKVWTSMAHVADVGELLVRTDPAAGKHAGLTMMLVDMAQPGITVRPLRQMTGGAAFNEVFLEDVAVPTADVVGELGQGWLVAGTSLNAERIAMMRGAGPLRPELLARYAELVGRQAPTDPVGIGRAVAAVVAMQELAGREVDAWPRLGAVAGSVSKLALVDAVSRIDATLPGLLGPALHQPLPDQDDWSSYVLGQHGLHLAGGSDEIHLNLVAQRGLGLPR